MSIALELGRELPVAEDVSPHDQTAENEALDRVVFAAQNGDEQAAAEAYGVATRIVESTARRFGSDDLTSESIMISALDKVLTRGILQEGYYRGGSFKAWVSRVATNAAISEFRKKRVGVRGFPDYIEELNFQRGDVAPAAENQALELNTSERIQALFDAAGVSDDFRAPYLLKHADGYAYHEIADMLGIPLGTVQSRIGRARAAILSHFDIQPDTKPRNLFDEIPVSA